MLIFYIVHRYSEKTEDARIKNLESVQEWADTLVQAAHEAGFSAAVIPWWEGIDPGHRDTEKLRADAAARSFNAFRALAAAAGKTIVPVVAVVRTSEPLSRGQRREIEDAVSLGLPVYPAEYIPAFLETLGQR